MADSYNASVSITTTAASPAEAAESLLLWIGDTFGSDVIAVLVTNEDTGTEYSVEVRPNSVVAHDI